MGGYGAAWAAAVPRTGNTACTDFTKHGFFGLSRSPAARHFSWSEPGPPTMLFTKHESRDTNHGLYCRRITSFSRVNPCLCLRITIFFESLRFFGPTILRNSPQFLGILRIPTSRCPLPALRPRRQNGFSAFHEPRNMVFPVPAATPRRATTSPANGFFSHHESRLFRPFPLTGRQAFLLERTRPPRPWFSRNTSHETRITAFILFSLLSCKLWSGMGRLWRGMGGLRPRHRQHGLYGFHKSRITAFSVHRPSAISPGANQTPNHGFHESRDTKHESRLFFESQLPYPRFPTISRHFPPFPGPPTPLRRSRSA